MNRLLIIGMTVAVLITLGAYALLQFRQMPPQGVEGTAPEQTAYQDMVMRNLTEQADTLATLRVIGRPDQFGVLIDIVATDEHIVVIDRFADQQIQLIERSSAEVVARTGRRGHGPGEFMSPSALFLERSGKAVWVYDFGKPARWTSLDLSQFMNRPEAILRLPPSLSEPTRLVNDTIVANGLFASELLRFYSPGGSNFEVVRAAGRSPFGDLHPDVALHVNESSLTYEPDLGRIALAFRYTGRIEVFDIEGRLLRSMAGPYEVPLHYRVVPDPREGMQRFLRTDDTRFAYLDVDSNPEYIFALFSGRARGDYVDGQEGTGNRIHVFRWDGRFVGEWIVEDDLFGIALDPRRGGLFGVRQLPFPAVVQIEEIPIE